MRTAKFQFEERRQQTILAEENSYCQDPPVEGDLIEVCSCCAAADVN